MRTTPPRFGETRPFLDDISTRWAIVGDPIQFVMRYAPAIERYLHAIVRDPSVAEEIIQDFVVKMLDRRFDRAAPGGGRFRSYLKQAIRNAVREHFRRRRPESLPDDMLAEYAVDAAADSAAERAWADEWRSCLLERAWQSLELRQRRSPGACYFEALRATADHPELASTALAALLSDRCGRPVSAATCRQWLSRGRRLMAECVWDETAATLEHPHPADVRDELASLGLMEFVRGYLPDHAG